MSSNKGLAAKFDEEILTGEFDILLMESENENEKRTISRLGTDLYSEKKSCPYIQEPTVTLQDTSDTAENNIVMDENMKCRPILSRCSIGKMDVNKHDDLIADERSNSYSESKEYVENHPVVGFLKQKDFRASLKRILEENYEVTMQISQKDSGNNLMIPPWVVHVTGNDETMVKNALSTVRQFLENFCSKIFDESAETNTIFYELCTDHEKISQTIKREFKTVDESLLSSSDVTTIEEKSIYSRELRKLEKKYLDKKIIIDLQREKIKLFGLTETIDEFQSEIQELNKKHQCNTVKVTLTEQQIHFLFNIHSKDLEILEAKTGESKIVESLRNGEFSAPFHLQSQILQQIYQWTTLVNPREYLIDDVRFQYQADQQHAELMKIAVNNHCYLEINEITKSLEVQIPKASVQDHISRNLTASAIQVIEGDLCDQKVDLIVISSKSEYLREDILKKAGSEVLQQYKKGQASKLDFIETDSGPLSCRKIIFQEWKIDQTSSENFYKSIRDFVRKPIQHAIESGQTSVAFPAIGCGQYGFDTKIIATQMLFEAQEQLIAANTLLQIFFVILPSGKKEVFQNFQGQLKLIQEDRISFSPKNISYKITHLKLKIIGSSIYDQDNCVKSIEDYVNTSVDTKEIISDLTLKRWTQTAINHFFQECERLKIHLQVDISIGYLKLEGEKNSLSKAYEKYLLKAKEESEQARLEANARDVIWSYQINEKTWERYSKKLNSEIEDAYSSKANKVEYIDQNKEKWQIDFQTNMERCLSNGITRKIARLKAEGVPKYWEPQSENVAVFSVPLDSDEYNEIRTFFNQGMNGKLTTIIRIDRIQNKAWHAQYMTSKKFFPKPETETRLFHGCPKDSAKLIINSFFNRSFAGVNGVLYGIGAYFSKKANYSDSYARAEPGTGERTMFVVDVLVGDTTIGNSKMKTPPPGFDSTTDGDHIIVAYRDDQAYASYLITYKSI